MMRPRPLGHLLTVCLTLVVVNATEGRARQVDNGDRIRYQVAGSEMGWQSGRLVSLNGDRLVVDRDGDHLTLDLQNVTALQTTRRNGKGAWIGAAIGAVVGPGIVASLADAPGSSDIAGIVVLGGLVGASWGSGRASRVVGTWGLVTGAIVGAVAFGTTQSACESGASTLCHYLLGGEFIGAVGLVVGSAIGMFVPNWVSITPDVLPAGPASLGGRRLGLEWSLRF